MTDAPIEYRFEVRRNSDGKIVAGDDEWTHGPAEEMRHAIEFYWSDGNFGCDCNRSIRFEGKYTEGRHPCGDTAYAVRLTLKDGTILLDEFSDD